MELKMARKKKTPEETSPTNQKFEVIRDTREKDGWWFDEDNYCAGTIVSKLDTGDYSIKGLEKVFVVERKKNLAEFAQNITQDRFERELERLDEFEYPFLVINCTLQNITEFPANSGLPFYLMKKTRIKPAFIWSKFIEYQVNHKVKIILAGNQGEAITKSLFRKVHKLLGADHGEVKE
jgi:hypothetical protein